jgi:hypothetical protein
MVDFDPRDGDEDRRDVDVQWVQLGRGSSAGRGNDEASERHQDVRERQLPSSERAADPREVLVAALDLPRGQDRELVLDGRDRYELNRNDVRTLATVGAFRVVPERHVSDGRENSYVFLYLMTGEVPDDFRLFLHRHRELPSTLYEWSIRVLVPRRFHKRQGSIGMPFERNS